MQIAHAGSDPYYDHATAQLFGVRKMIGVPVFNDDRVRGIILIGWPEMERPRPADLEVLQTFAGQASITIENARRFDDMQEAVARQTASAGVLRIISQSPTDITPVFEQIVQSFIDLVSCDRAKVFRRDEAEFWQSAAATRNGLDRDHPGEGRH